LPSESHPDKKFAGLEIARFLCALAVMFVHYQVFFMSGMFHKLSSNQMSQLPLYSIFSFFYNNGQLAVQIFWMISGFIFTWKYSYGINKGAVSAYRFFVLRFSRLYPLHFVTLIAMALMQLIYIKTHDTSFVVGNNNAFHFVLQLAFASNWLDSLPQTFNAPIWSVSVEILAYAFFFVVVSFVRPGLVLYLVIALAARIAGHFYPQNVFQCVEFFFIGGAVQSVIGSLSRRRRQAAFVVCALGLCLSIATHFAAGGIIAFSVFVVGSFVMLGEVIQLSQRITQLGDLTYASYLIHFPIQMAAVLIVDRVGFSRNLFLSPWALAAFIVGAFGLAWFVFRAFEMPAQDMLRRIGTLDIVTKPVTPPRSA
jgi:peptidoglycan/LPS O-acetylase OafA/YrhL